MNVRVFIGGRNDSAAVYTMVERVGTVCVGTVCISKRATHQEAFKAWCCDIRQYDKPGLGRRVVKGGRQRTFTVPADVAEIVNKWIVDGGRL